MRYRLLAIVVVALAGAAEAASAQGLGLGARTTSVRSAADPADADAQRLHGGAARVRTSARTGIEIAIDYRSTFDEVRRERVKEYPLQLSLLLYPATTRLSPYLIGGAGWYSRRVETLDADDAVIQAGTTRPMGVHTGLGLELQLSRRLVLYGDYRYTFVRFGDPDEGTVTEPGALPLPGTRGLQERLNLSHEGSMWVFGATVVF